MQDWSRISEQIMLSAVESRIRVLGFTSPAAGSGVSTVARVVAEAFAQAGTKTLLLDLTTPVRTDARPPLWSPGAPGAADATRVEPSGLAVLTADASIGTRALFNNIEQLQKTLQRDLATYSAIIIDLPAVADEEPTRLNPIAAARACDAVLMVCLTGHVDRSELNEATAALKPAGVNLSGLVLNDYYATTLGEEVADATYNSVGKYFPGIADKIASRVMQSRFLGERFRFIR